MQNWTELLPLVLIVVVGWALLVRPMRKRQRQMAEIQRNLAVGSTIMLTSGIFGDVEEFDDSKVRLAVAPGTTITVARQVVAQVVDSPTGDDDLPSDSD